MSSQMKSTGSHITDITQPSRVLIVKTSSLGDVIHALPALSDARRRLPNTTFDWLVEENFKDIPAAHPAVHRVLPVALRRWRQAPVRAVLGDEFAALRKSLREYAYDLVIDAQGLLKSAMLTTLVPAPVTGLDRQSLREPLARFFYDQTIAVPRNQHAVERVRQLFAGALHYPAFSSAPDYGLRTNGLQRKLQTDHSQPSRRIIFLHGTTWPSKHLPERYWRELATCIGASGFEVVIPWGNSTERERAKRIADRLDHVTVLPRLELGGLMEIIADVAGAFCVDTGLGHLATALGVPALAFYGPTDPALTGNYGVRQIQYQNQQLDCVPCLNRDCRLITRERPDQPCFMLDSAGSIWARLQRVMEEDSHADPGTNSDG